VFDLQIGANDDNKVRVDLPEISTFTLGLIGVDLVKYPQEAIEVFDRAISGVTDFRTQAGSMQNRLEHAVDANAKTAEAELGAYSAIVDLDYFKEMTAMTKGQILVSSSGAMTAQANTIRENILNLLESLGTSG
jgi:flagellin